MAAIFAPGANLASSLVLVAAAAVAVVLVFIVWAEPYWQWASGVGFHVEQPVPFSHEHHVAGLGLDCRFCHATVEISADAGMPPTYTCMTCHSQIWTNAAILEPVRKSLAIGEPLHWVRVYQLPDYAYFNHSIHVAKGIGCATCHGRIDHMPLTAKATTLRMSWCIDCHRNPKPNLRPKDAIFDLAWQRTADTPSPDDLAKSYHIHSAHLTDCSVCHR